MTTEPWGETIGQMPGEECPESYADCWHRRCPDCGAEPETKCTFVIERGGVRERRPRHMPCIARQKTPTESGANL